MAIGAAAVLIPVGIELAKVLIPVIRDMISSGKAPDGTALTSQMIADARTANDALTTKVDEALKEAAKDN